MIRAFADHLEKIALAPAAGLFGTSPSKKRPKKKPDPDLPWDKPEGERGRKGEYSMFDVDAEDWKALEGAAVNSTN